MSTTTWDLTQNRAAKDMLRRDPCAYCGATPTAESPSTIDHVDARAHGGADHWSNFTAACALCNSAKCDRPLLDFLLGLPRRGGGLRREVTPICIEREPLRRIALAGAGVANLRSAYLGLVQAISDGQEHYDHRLAGLGRREWERCVQQLVGLGIVERRAGTMVVVL